MAQTRQDAVILECARLVIFREMIKQAK